MSIELVRKVSLGYIRLFPELLDRYYDVNDHTIVKLISEKISDSNELKGIVNINEIEKTIVEELDQKKNEC